MRLRPDTRRTGAVLVLAGAALPIVLGAIGLFVDIAGAWIAESRMRAIARAAADGAVLHVRADDADSSSTACPSQKSTATSVARSVIDANFADDSLLGTLDPNIAVSCVDDATVRVRVQATWPVTLVRLVGIDGNLDVAAVGAARDDGGGDPGYTEI